MERIYHNKQLSLKGKAKKVSQIKFWCTENFGEFKKGDRIPSDCFNQNHENIDHEFLEINFNLEGFVTGGNVIHRDELIEFKNLYTGNELEVKYNHNSWHSVYYKFNKNWDVIEINNLDTILSIRYTYDSLGNILKKQFFKNGDKKEPPFQFLYDQNNRVIKALKEYETCSYMYNSDGYLSELLIEEKDGIGYLKNLEPDKDDSIGYKFNTYNHCYDAIGYNEPLPKPDGEYGELYDYSYNEKKQISGRKRNTPITEVIHHEEYRYDALGNIINIFVHEDGRYQNWNFKYDNDGRIIEEEWLLDPDADNEFHDFYNEPTKFKCPSFTAKYKYINNNLVEKNFFSYKNELLEKIIISYNEINKIQSITIFTIKELIFPMEKDYDRVCNEENDCEFSKKENNIYYLKQVFFDYKDGECKRKDIINYKNKKIFSGKITYEGNIKTLTIDCVSKTGEQRLMLIEKYNELNELIESKFYSDKGDLTPLTNSKKLTFSYLNFDEFGNWLRKVIYESDAASYLIERQIEYY